MGNAYAIQTISFGKTMKEEVKKHTVEQKLDFKFQQTVVEKISRRLSTPQDVIDRYLSFVEASMAYELGWEKNAATRPEEDKEFTVLLRKTSEWGVLISDNIADKMRCVLFNLFISCKKNKSKFSITTTTFDGIC